ncbi:MULTISPECIES: hypothetical protein [Photorhabdus]|uniref:DUF3742 domain-containing protein n=3 Tax=Photorhabdus TaxID=29487 RepID=A0ABX0AXH8_9GAMM|nr:MULTISPECIES: hypothetical protein [Photorhabdus]PQQ40070.1 hypothetical protein C6H65_17140 [Photorhabdus luminescens]NDL01251.1 hypothetical protein [Photorhabdus bodei]NDL05522.1 hypothetical protein [Photorhabdus bodei]NDL09754.1 hypothetical protein [Photorhabdus bodei]OCA55355.1 hypothetical protein Phpb_01571 [Photorhabdus namnaonensis]
MTDNHDTQRTMRAQIRGAKVAGIYLNLCQRLRTWDANCVTKAHKHNLPTWVGHLPIYLLAASLATTLLMGTLMVVGVIMLIFGIILGFSLNKGVIDKKLTDEQGYGNQYRDGPYGWGWYDATGYIDVDNKDE